MKVKAVTLSVGKLLFNKRTYTPSTLYLIYKIDGTVLQVKRQCFNSPRATPPVLMCGGVSRIIFLILVVDMAGIFHYSDALLLRLQRKQPIGGRL